LGFGKEQRILMPRERQNHIAYLAILCALGAACSVSGCHKKASGVNPNSLGPEPAPAAAAPTATITADPAAIDLGQSVILYWRSQNGTTATVDGIGEVNLNGRQTISPSNSTTFHLVVKGDGGTTEASVRVTVRVPVAPIAPEADRGPAPIEPPISPITITPIGPSPRPKKTTGRQEEMQLLPPSPVAPPPVSPAPPILLAHEKLIEQGVISYDPPNQMTLGEPVAIDAAIRRPNGEAVPFVPDNVQAQAIGLTGTGPITSQTLPVSDEMVVTLRSKEAGAFKIDPPDPDLTKETKLLEKGGHAEWHWIVTPLIQGEQHLLLHSVFVVHLPDGTTAPSDQGSFVTTITITVEPWYRRAPKFVASAIKEHWTGILGWFLPASALPFIAAWWKKRRKHLGG
jgi:hypothetical protein